MNEAAARQWAHRELGRRAGAVRKVASLSVSFTRAFQGAIFLCETSHPQICLVEFEPDHDSILLEKYAKTRDAATWTAELSKSIEGLPVRVIRSTSDESAGLLGPARKYLGVHHSPDLFRCQHDLSKAISIVLTAQTQRAEEAMAAAIAFKQRLHENGREWLASAEAGGPSGSDFAPCFARVGADGRSAEQALEAARARQERARKAIRGIGDDYHPVDLSIGTSVELEAVNRSARSAHRGKSEPSRRGRAWRTASQAHRQGPNALAGTRSQRPLSTPDPAQPLDDRRGHIGRGGAALCLAGRLAIG